MKRKALVLIALCSLGILAWDAQATSFETLPINIMGEGIPHGWEEIELHGSLATLVGPNAIEVGASDDAVYISFNQSFGNVSISIYNSMGVVVYNTVVNTDVQQVVIIPFTATNGSYTIELSNTHGYADGDFERN